MTPHFNHQVQKRFTGHKVSIKEVWGSQEMGVKGKNNYSTYKNTEYTHYYDFEGKCCLYGVLSKQKRLSA